MTANLGCKRHDNDYYAFGLVSKFIRNVKPFCRESFQKMTNNLMGQIKRKHYLMAFEDKLLVGYIGWCLTSEAIADKWLNENYNPTYEEGINGDCILVLTLHARDKAGMFHLVRSLKKLLPDYAAYWKRVYPDGRVRHAVLRKKGQA